MKIRDLLEASVNQPIIAYHGTPANIEQFDSSFLGKGLDQLGSGFYFTNDYDDALTYTDDKRNVLKVSLNVKKPLNSTATGSINQKQALAIIKQSPTLDDDLSNFGDVEYEGYQKVLNDAVKSHVFSGEEILLGLHKIANDFFDGNEATFNRAVQKVLGYDSVIHYHPTGVIHYVAFFPEQITIIK